MKHVKMFGKSVPLIAIVLVGILTLGAGATLLTYYNTISGSVDVQQAVLVDDEGINTPIVEDFGDVTGGDTVCTYHTLENLAVIPAPVSFGTEGDNDGIMVSYLAPVEYSLSTTAGGVNNDPVKIDVTDDGTYITWTIDFPGDAPYDEATQGNGLRAVGLVIALDGEPAFQIHNTDSNEMTLTDGTPLVAGTWAMSPWGPTIEDGWYGWHSGDTNTLVDEIGWVSCTGGRYNEDNPNGIFTITIDKSEFGCCATGFHWALNLAIGSGFCGDYMVYEQMAYPPATPGPSFNWGEPLVDEQVDNYEYAVIADEITGVILDPGELFKFVICYQFPINVAGNYEITTYVNVD